MAKKTIRFLITVFGAFLGFGVVWMVYKYQNELGVASLLTSIPIWAKTLLYVVFMVIFGVIFFFITPGIINSIAKLTGRMERETNSLSMQQIFVGVIGLLAGLLIAALISLLIQKIPFVWIVIPLDVIVFVIFGYLGWKIPTSRSKEINFPNWFRKGEASHPIESIKAMPKILDTSAIIDGRFFDVYKTGIVEGRIIVPGFVLDELRHIADSADPLKRTRGRRGLDSISLLREENPEKVSVHDADYADLAEVDTKLLRLATELNGIVVTNDYNLNKVASVQGVPIFNINDLANSLRINVVAGEIIDVLVVKEGKEHGQGVGYFDDGTMIVIDGAGPFVGETVTSMVTSVLQTSAGKMVFAKLGAD
ncbi:MAG: TRAM domain-containing protein [Clostridia bacterium]|nr:TRAM domain-containing protein [Clostridia bacterium]